jgi:hypothetical protein
MARTFYDDVGFNQDIELDLSMLEATGLITHDESGNRSMATMHWNLVRPLWLQTSSGRFGLSINPALPLIDTRHYLDIPAADCANLDFTTTDYSLAVWFYWGDSGSTSQVMMGKYVVSSRGWEVYLSEIGALRYLTVRHHHAGGASLRTASYSLDWVYSEWHLFSYSRIGTTGYHYRDGEPITTVSDVLIDPESSAADDFRIGCRYTEDSNWWKARFHRPRAWSRALTAADHRQLFAAGYP